MYRFGFFLISASNESIRCSTARTSLYAPGSLINFATLPGPLSTFASSMSSLPDVSFSWPLISARFALAVRKFFTVESTFAGSIAPVARLSDVIVALNCRDDDIAEAGNGSDRSCEGGFDREELPHGEREPGGDQWPAEGDVGQARHAAGEG